MADPVLNGPPLVIGTRKSPLALAQAEEAQAALSRALSLPLENLPLAPMTSTGDMILNRSLSEAGGKGLFTKELDEALLAQTIDIAVHSAKDLPTELPRGLVIAGYLPREDVRDALVTHVATDLASLPQGAVIGTASLRRQAMVLRNRPDCRVTLLRGNVGTRLKKLEGGDVHATLLALAGLKRLGLAHHATAILAVEDFLPAVGQGAIAIVTREGDERAARAVAAIDHAPTHRALLAERAFLTVLDGSCKTPIAGHATLDAAGLRFRGLVLTPDGRDEASVAAQGAPEDAERIGREAGTDLKSRLPAGWVGA